MLDSKYGPYQAMVCIQHQHFSPNKIFKSLVKKSIFQYHKNIFLASACSILKQEETCNADKTHVGAEVLSYEWIEASPQAMVEALEDGPIAVAMMVVNSFYSYK